MRVLSLKKYRINISRQKEAKIARSESEFIQPERIHALTRRGGSATISHGNFSAPNNLFETIHAHVCNPVIHDVANS